MLVNTPRPWIPVDLLWTIQQMRYPLFGRVDIETYLIYQHKYMADSILPVFLFMVMELIITFTLALNPSHTMPLLYLWLAGSAIAVIWSVAMLSKMPQQIRPGIEFNYDIYFILVKSNWY